MIWLCLIDCSSASPGLWKPEGIFRVSCGFTGFDWWLQNKLKKKKSKSAGDQHFLSWRRRRCSSLSTGKMPLLALTSHWDAVDLMLIRFDFNFTQCICFWYSTYLLFFSFFGSAFFCSFFFSSRRFCPMVAEPASTCAWRATKCISE